MPKQNAFIAAVNREVKRQMVQYEQTRMQIALDAYLMTVNELYNVGASRAQESADTFIRNIATITDLINTDAKDDKELEYAKAVIDRRILQIVGEGQFVDFDGRYCR